jgi:hypothetical protein
VQGNLELDQHLWNPASGTALKLKHRRIVNTPAHHYLTASSTPACSAIEAEERHAERRGGTANGAAKEQPRASGRIPQPTKECAKLNPSTTMGRCRAAFGHRTAVTESAFEWTFQ